MKIAIKWLKWVACKRESTFITKSTTLRSILVVVNPPMEEFNAQMQTVYQFHGYYWHGHDCALNQGEEFNEKCKKPMRCEISICLGA